MRFRQKGFNSPEVIFILLIVAVVGFVGWRLYDSRNSQTTVNLPAKSTSFKRIVAVGDIVCDPQDSHVANPDVNYCQDEKVTQQIDRIKPDAVLALGDLQYNDGALDKFQTIFSKNWSRFQSIMYPTPGNHEYETPQASGYYTYFKDSPVDVSKGYYSFKLGDWQMLSLNSNCDNIGGCAADSAQLTWLESELSASQTSCTLAFWHHPRFTSGEYANDAKSKSYSDALWPKLLAHQADVVLNGHDHIYERFGPQTTDGQALASGLRQLTAGTGGRSHYQQTTTAANSQKIIDDQFGVLVLDLYPDSYSWQFINTDSQVLDSGQASCH